jgi:hypothetical protein
MLLPLTVEINKAAPMSSFFACHTVEDRGRSGEILPEPLSIIDIRTLVIFFERYRERQHLAFRKTIDYC